MTLVHTFCEICLTTEPEHDHGACIDFNAGYDILIKENRILREALFPRPEIKDCSPLILYFDTKADRDEFVDLVGQAKPNMRSYKV